MTKKKLFLTLIIFILVQLTSVYGQTTISMKKENGVYTVPCVVNGLKLRFIFDTGASDVSISMTEALFMLKNDYLEQKDVFGKEYYKDATGEISEGTKIILRKIEFSGIVLYNIEASVVHQLGAPLLLGQSAMAKLGKFQFDPINGTVTILNASNNSNSTNSISSTNSNYKTVPSTNTSTSTANSKLPTYTGNVQVFTFSSLYEKPDQNSKVVGHAKDNVVRIIRKENDNFYYGTSGDVMGYIWVGFIKEKHLELNPESYSEIYNRGNAKLELKDYFGAVSDYKKAIEINNAIPDGYNQVAWALYLQGDFHNALPYATKAIQLAPDLANAIDTRGCIYFGLLNYQMALVDFNKAIELDAKLGNSYLYRGRTYYQLNKKQNACEDWSKAGELGKVEASDFIQKYCNK